MAIRNVLFLVAIILLAQLAPVARADDTATGPAIEFLDIDAAKEAIVDDSKEPYFSRFGDAEMAAKTALDVPDDSREKRIETVKKQYAEAVRAFTPGEEETIRWYIDRLKEPLETDYPRFAAIPWRFIKVRGDLEAGMPHTRVGCIVLSERVLPAMTETRQKAAPQAAMARMGAMLVHEKLHVMQRQEPERFEDLYRNVWGFEKAKTIEGSEKLKSRWLVNPDGPDVNWVMPIRGEDQSVRYVWPLVLLGGGEHPSLNQMHMTAISVKKTSGENFTVVTDDAGEPRAKELLSDEGYREKFFPSTYIYHPNEAAADLFSRVVVMDHFNGKDALREVPDADRMEAALVTYGKWFKEHLAR